MDQLTDLWQAELHHGVTLAETANHACIGKVKEPKMTERQPTTGTREIAQGRPLDDGLEHLDAEVVEDLDVDEDAEDVAGGTTWTCPTA